MKDGLPVYRTQTACALAIHFDLCEDKQKVGDLLCELIHENDDTLTTGFVGTPYLLHALTNTGHADLAYTLALTDKFPSWLYSVKMGATTVWEHWDGINEKGEMWSKSMNSYNHYAYGAIGDWMYGVMAGIKTDENAPGYKNVKLAPIPDKRLSYVKASVDTRCGVVKSEWNIEGDTVTYKFTVPENSTADITIAGVCEHVGAGEYTYTSKI
jgi:alpha-L-rhamnosidase